MRRMGKQTHHRHPNPAQYKFQQIAQAALLLVMVLTAIALGIIALLIGAPLFIIMGVLVLLLAAPVLMALVTTPAVTVNEGGITLHPVIGGERTITWERVEAVRSYPLLPAPEQEVVQRWLIGRKKYRAAEGLMLIVPDLPLQYRIAGFLAGAHSQPLIAVTNRTHSEYGQLAAAIRRHAAHAFENDD
jgi:hypothetical protein